MNEKRDTKLTVWFTFDDLEIIDAAAQASFMTRSAFVRAVLTDAAYRRMGRDRVAEVLGQVGGM
ncbi:MAG: hypothetical protein Q8Q14_09305 [Gemmatimonadales bacterium]|nr:hypothetical protein [Gemmatimonadales bacterium]